VLRFVLLVLGVAAAVSVSLTARAVPNGLDASHARADARAIHAAAPGAPAHFRFRVLDDDSYDGRPWTRVLLARGSTATHPPPGLTALPAPGQIIVSPAIASAARHDPGLRQRLGGPITSTIGDAGLEGPDDQYSYIGVTEAQLGSEFDDGAGFGGQASLQTAPKKAIVFELLLLVGLPALLFLSTCARLSAATRARRLAALRILGFSRREIIAVSAWEAGLGAVLGAVLGALLYAAINTLLPGSGLVGTTWFTHDTQLSLTGLLVIMVAVALLAIRLAAAGMRRVLSGTVQTRRDAVDGSSSWWRVLPLVMGLSVLVAFLVRTIGKHGFSASGQKATVLGTVLATIGVVVALRPLVASAASQLARRATSLSTRLGARRLQYEPSSVIRVVTGLVALVLVAAVGTGVLRDATLAASPAGKRLVLRIDAAEVPAADRFQAATLSGRHAVAALHTHRDPPPDTAPATPAARLAVFGVDVLYASCSDLRDMLAQSLPSCRPDTAYRLQDPEQPDAAPTAGFAAVLDTDAGKQLPVTTPAAVLAVAHLTQSPIPNDGMVITTTTAPEGGWPASTYFFYSVGHDQTAVSKLQNDLARTAPLAHVVVSGGSLQDLESYTLLKRTLLLGAALGFLLALLSFAVAAADRAVERRAAIATLVVVGTPVRTLRTAQQVQLLVPLVMGLSLAALVGSISAAGYLRAGGLQQGWYPGSTLAALALAAVGVAAGLVSASVVVGRRPRTEFLRRE